MDELQSYTFIESSKVENAEKKFTNENKPIGLKKIDKIIYINPVLQLIGGIQPLYKYFTINKDINNKNSLSFETKELFNHLYNDEKTKLLGFFDTSNYLETLKLLNIMIEKELINPCDILILILDILHEENESDKSEYLEIKQNRYNTQNLNEVINKEIKYIKKKNRSIIKDCLNYIQIQTLKCPKTNTQFFRLKNFFTFNISICDVHQNRISSNNNSILTIQDCIESIMRKNNFSIQFYCEVCQAYHESKEVLYEFYEIGEKFIILLDKCIHSSTYVTNVNIALEIQEKIDLGNYMTNKNKGSIYTLTGIVSYVPSNKNFVCFSKSFLDNEWYLYTDENVEKYEIKKILEHNSKDVYIPCILLYSKKGL